MSQQDSKKLVIDAKTLDTLVAGCIMICWVISFISWVISYSLCMFFTWKATSLSELMSVLMAGLYISAVVFITTGIFLRLCTNRMKRKG